MITIYNRITDDLNGEPKERIVPRCGLEFCVPTPYDKALADFALSSNNTHLLEYLASKFQLLGYLSGERGSRRVKISGDDFDTFEPTLHNLDIQIANLHKNTFAPPCFLDYHFTLGQREGFFDHRSTKLSGSAIEYILEDPNLSRLGPQIIAEIQTGIERAQNEFYSIGATFKVDQLTVNTYRSAAEHANNYATQAYYLELARLYEDAFMFDEGVRAGDVVRQNFRSNITFNIKLQKAVDRLAMERGGPVSMVNEDDMPILFNSLVDASKEILLICYTDSVLNKQTATFMTLGFNSIENIPLDETECEVIEKRYNAKLLAALKGIQSSGTIPQEPGYKWELGMATSLARGLPNESQEFAQIFSKRITITFLDDQLIDKTGLPHVIMQKESELIASRVKRKKNNAEINNLEDDALPAQATCTFESGTPEETEIEYELKYFLVIYDGALSNAFPITEEEMFAARLLGKHTIKNPDQAYSLVEQHAIHTAASALKAKTIGTDRAYSES